MVKAMSPSSTSSGWPVTITGCAALQFAAVKVTDGVTTTSLASDETRVTVTLAPGWAVRTMVNWSVVPPSSVTSPATGVTETPATSLSVTQTDGFGASNPA